MPRSKFLSSNGCKIMTTTGSVPRARSRIEWVSWIQGYFNFLFPYYPTTTGTGRENSTQEKRAQQKNWWILRTKEFHCYSHGAHGPASSCFLILIQLGITFLCTLKEEGWQKEVRDERETMERKSTKRWQTKNSLGMNEKRYLKWIPSFLSHPIFSLPPPFVLFQPFLCSFFFLVFQQQQEKRWVKNEEWQHV